MRRLTALFFTIVLVGQASAQESELPTGLEFDKPNLRFNAGTGMAFNSKDFLWSFSAGVGDMQNLWSARFNVDFRPYYRKVLVKQVDDYYYQYREKRFFISMELNKFFLPLHVHKNSFGFYVQSDQGFYIGHYRGTGIRPASYFVVSPGGGFAANLGRREDKLGGLFLKLGYNYFKTVTPSLPDGQIRIDLSINF